eukprot:8995641-Alexandrium_andersonii.AAC.1
MAAREHLLCIAKLGAAPTFQGEDPEKAWFCEGLQNLANIRSGIVPHWGLRSWGAAPTPPRRRS